MHGKKIQAVTRVRTRKLRVKEGFRRRKNHGIEVPMIPATVASAMYRMDRRKVAVHVRVWEFGNRLDSEVAAAAERHPVTIRSRISVGVVWVGGPGGVGCVVGGAVLRVEIGGSSVNVEDDCSRVMTRCSDGGIFSNASPFV